MIMSIDFTEADFSRESDLWSVRERPISLSDWSEMWERPCAREAMCTLDSLAHGLSHNTGSWLAETDHMSKWERPCAREADFRLSRIDFIASLAKISLSRTDRPLSHRSASLAQIRQSDYWKQGQRVIWLDKTDLSESLRCQRVRFVEILTNF